MSCEELFLKQLRQHGYRLTPQRELVLLVLHQIGHPAPAEEIFKLVAGQNDGIELSTVYRTLDLLTSMNLVSIIDAGEKERLFELEGKEAPHLHLVCRGCGKIIGYESDLLLSLMESIKNGAHFAAEIGSLTIPGLCSECSQEALTN
jgi:Fur family ferric uptake transcriptional regulator